MAIPLHFFSNPSTARVPRRSRLELAWLPLLFVVGCASTPTKEEQYEKADTSADLSTLVVKDLQEGKARESYEALRAFTVENVGADRATYAHAVFTQARPVLAFQRYGGHAYIGAVSELGRVLQSASQQELDRLYASFAGGDVDAIRRSLAGDRTALCAANATMDPELLPHRQFFEGVAALDDFRNNRTRHPSEVWRAVDLMDRAGWSFSREGMQEQYFYSLIVSAQALDEAGLADRAMEKWYLASKSSYLPRVNADFRKLVETRIAATDEKARREAEAQKKVEAAPATPPADAGVQPPATTDQPK